ncbi:MAG TPA: O-antigen ligase family protein [Duganella sp.]|uniref:O-antigen ligase family protein n=1 Tax=Duganella sp. TaxID=1904440 RepID=UPI002ED601EB
MAVLLKWPAFRSFKAPDIVKNPFRPVYLLGFLLVCVAGVLGAATPILVDLMGGSLSKVMALPAAILFGLLIIYDRKLTLLMIILFRASGDNVLELTRFSIGSYPVGVGGVINAMVILLAMLLVFEKPSLVPRRGYMAWLPFLLVTMLGVFTSPEKGDAARLFLTQLSYFAIFVGGYYCVRSMQDFRFCMKLMLWSSVIPILYSFYILAYVKLAVGGEFRMRGTFGHPNVMAFYLTVIVAVAFYLLKTLPAQTPTRVRAGLVLYMLVLLAMLVLTKTRSAWTATGLAFGLYALIFERRYLIYMAVLGALALFIPGVGDRLSDLGQGNQVSIYSNLNSFAWRVYLWETAIAWMSPISFIIGNGLQSFVKYSIIFFPIAGKVAYGAHSVYVQLLFELGVFGLITFGWLGYSLLKQLMPMFKIDKLAGYTLVVMMVNLLVCSFSDNMFYYLSYNWYLWFAVGAGCALFRLAPAAAKPAATALHPAAARGVVAPVRAPY